MKVINEGPDKLTIKLSPYLLRGIGILFLLTGLLFFALLNNQNTLRCEDKSPGVAKGCVLKHYMIGVHLYSDHIDDLKKASLRQYRNSKFNVQYHILLNGLKHDAIANVMPTFSVGSSKKAVDAINHYINHSSKKHYSLPFIINDFLLIFWIGFTLCGFVLLTCSYTILISCDKTLKQLCIIRQNLFKQHSKTYLLEEIDKLALESKQWIFIRYYRFAFVFKDGHHMPLTNNYDDTPVPKLKLANQLNIFLGLPTDKSLEDANAYRKTRQYISSRVILYALILMLLGYILGFIGTLQF